MKQGGTYMAEDSGAVCGWVFQPDGKVITSLLSTTGLVVNQWTHLAFVRDTAANECRLLVNGEKTASAPAGHPTALPLGSLCQSTLFAFGGAFCDLRIWDVARKDAEILDSMKQRVTDKESGLVASWPLDEGVGALRGISTRYQGLVGVASDVTWQNAFKDVRGPW